MTKKVLRKLFKGKRSQLTLAQRKIASSHIFGHLAEHFKWENKVISIFLPIARLNELETAPIIEFLAKKNTLALPFTMLEQLAMGHRKLSDDTIITNNEWGIPEPQNGEIIHPALLDVIFIPLLISDEKGYRVGYGKGFYDRFLENCRGDALLIGLNYFPSIATISDTEGTDVPLDYLISPKGIEAFKR